MGVQLLDLASPVEQAVGLLQPVVY